MFILGAKALSEGNPAYYDFVGFTLARPGQASPGWSRPQLVPGPVNIYFGIGTSERLRRQTKAAVAAVVETLRIRPVGGGKIFAYAKWR